jgi:hypothetical protein
VVLLDDVVEVLALLQPHSARQYGVAFQRSDRSGVSWILIDIDDSRYWIIRRAKYLSKETLRSSRIAFGCGVPGTICASGGETNWNDGPGFSVPVRWLEIGLFLFQ